MDEQTAKALDSIASTLRENSRARMLEHTMPIHAVHGEGNPIAHGSGVLLRIADVSFLLSCAHVLKVASEDGAQLVIPSSDGTPLVVLTGVDFRWTADERIDLAFAVLPSSIAELLPPGKSFLRLSDLEFDCSERVGVYCVVGYPAQMTDRDSARATIGARPISFTTYLLNGRLDGHVDGVTIALVYEANAVGDSKGERARPPSLKGISGCGIWRLAAMDVPPPPSWSPQHVKLVGIEHGVAKNAIKGSHVAVLIDLIKREFPALRSCIELHTNGV